MTDDLVLIGAATAIFLSLSIAGVILVSPGTRTSTISERRTVGRRKLTQLAERASTTADDYLSRGSGEGAFGMALERAGWNVRAGEFVVAAVGGALGVFVVGFLLAGLFAGLALAGLVMIVAWVLLQRRIRQRQEAFAEQLQDVLMLLIGNLQAGFGISQSLTSVAEVVEAPASDELNRVIREHRLGRDLEDGLVAMADRLGSQDFAWVAQAIAVNRDVGGDLTEVLQNVIATISDRQRLRGQIKALSADGRMSAIVLISLPFVLAGGLSVLNPGYLNPLIETGVGRIAIVGAVVLEAAGAFWIRKITDITL